MGNAHFLFQVESLKGTTVKFQLITQNILTVLKGKKICVYFHHYTFLHHLLLFSFYYLNEELNFINITNLHNSSANFKTFVIHFERKLNFFQGLLVNYEIN